MAALLATFTVAFLVAAQAHAPPRPLEARSQVPAGSAVVDGERLLFKREAAQDVAELRRNFSNDVRSAVEYLNASQMMTLVHATQEVSGIKGVGLAIYTTYIV
jgi:hypothetical protein